jgi:hypothetical protein
MISAAMPLSTQGTRTLRQPRPLEQFARLAAAAGLMLVFVALWMPFIQGIALSEAKELRILPRLSIFGALLLQASILVRAGLSRTQIVLLTLGAAAISLALLGTASTAGPSGFGGLSGTVGPGGPGGAVEALRLSSESLMIVALGLLLGAWVESAGILLSCMACAIVGGIWCGAFQVVENSAADSAFQFFRLAWPARYGTLAPAPGLPEALLVAVVAGASVRLRLPLFSVAMGAFAGFCSASFLNVGPWSQWPGLSAILVSSGILIACWPDMELRMSDLARALFFGGTLMAILVLSEGVRAHLQPPVESPAESARFRSYT